MMICPQTKAECDCNEFGQDKTCPPKPSMAEIVRLIRNLIAASYNAGRSRVGIRTPEEVESCAALMAAIRLLSNSTQHGE